MNEQSSEEKEHTKRLYKILEDASLSVKIRKLIEEIGIEEAWNRLNKSRKAFPYRTCNCCKDETI